MAIQGDGGGIQHEVFAIGSGLPASTGAMCIAVQFRLESDLDRLGGIACLVKYSGTPTGHMGIVDSDGTSLKLLSNYFENAATDVVEDLTVGTAYTLFMEGNSTTLTLSLIEEGDTTILTESTTQDVFAPERLYLFGTNSSGSNESSHATVKWVRIWETTLSDSEKRAEHIASSPQKSGAITNRPFTGGNLSTALSTGTGALFQVGSGGGISYVEWEDAPAPKTVTITITSDVDLEDAEVPGGTAPTITTTALSSGQVGVPYFAQVVVTGSQPISIGASGLPDGLTISSDGSITGTPAGANGLGGTYTISVTAENDYGSDSKSLSLFIADAGVSPPVITTEQLPSGTVGSAYSFTFAATGAGPFTWSFSGLPPGVVASGATISSGSLPVAGNYTVRAQVTGAGGASGFWDFPLAIAPRPAPTRIASPWGAALKRGR